MVAMSRLAGVDRAAVERHLFAGDRVGQQIEIGLADHVLGRFGAEAPGEGQRAGAVDEMLVLQRHAFGRFAGQVHAAQHRRTLKSLN